MAIGKDSREHAAYVVNMGIRQQTAGIEKGTIEDQIMPGLPASVTIVEKSATRRETAERRKQH